MVQIRKCDKCDKTSNIQILNVFTEEYHCNTEGWQDWFETIDLCPEHLAEYTKILHKLLRDKNKDDLGSLNTKFIERIKSVKG